jgi:CHAD domain-containing protein
MTVTDRIERELKLEVDASVDLAGLSVVAGYSVVSLPEAVLDASYYDTDHYDLAQWGITLRYRSSAGGSGSWTLKLPHASTGPGLRRDEIDFSAPPGDIPEQARHMVVGYLRGRPLVAVAQLRTFRRRRLLLSPTDTVAELDDDLVEFEVSDGRRGRFRELEVELVPAAPDSALVEIGLHLRSIGACEQDPRPKLLRAVGATASRVARRGAPKPDRAASGAEVLQSAIEAGTRRLLVNDPGVRLGEDDEAVHQARVATRRLRSDLGTLSPFVDPSWAERIGDPLGRLGSLLGEVRDGDVLGSRLKRLARELDAEDQEPAGELVGRLRATRDAHLEVLVAHMGSAEYLGLTATLLQACDQAPVSEEASEPARRRLRRLVGRRWDQLEARVGALEEDPPAAELHRVRISVKRCRYAAELAVGVFGDQALQLAKALASVQEVLGELQDSEMATAWLRQGASDADGRQGVAAGQMIALERRRADAARWHWRNEWDCAEDKSLRKWLR